MLSNGINGWQAILNTLFLVDKLVCFTFLNWSDVSTYFVFWSSINSFIYKCNEINKCHIKSSFIVLVTFSTLGHPERKFFYHFYLVIVETNITFHILLYLFICSCFFLKNCSKYRCSDSFNMTYIFASILKWEVSYCFLFTKDNFLLKR